MNQKTTGIVICFILAGLAWYLGSVFPLIGGAVFGILLGMTLASCFKGLKTWKDGYTFSGKRILQLSVILLGFQMNFGEVLAVGGSSLWIMFFTLSITFTAAWFFSKMLRLDSVTSILIGVGTAICGGSAIAATAPVIRAKEEEIARAISTIFLFNIAAVFVFPAVGHLLDMSELGFGIWAGTAVNDTSSVLATAYAYSDYSGELATIVKLTRTLMIIPVTFVLSLYMTYQSDEKTAFSFSHAFPWFVIGFVLASLLNTADILPSALSKGLNTFGKFLIVVAMTGIGLNTDLVKLLKNGMKPILLGFLCWVVLAVTSLIVQNYMGLL